MYLDKKRREQEKEKGKEKGEKGLFLARYKKLVLIRVLEIRVGNRDELDEDQSSISFSPSLSHHHHFFE